MYGSNNGPARVLASVNSLFDIDGGKVSMRGGISAPMGGGGGGYQAPQNRYLDKENLARGRYQTKKPELRHTKLREDTTPQAHIHVNASINLGLPQKRRENIARYMAAGNARRVFGTQLDYGKTDDDMLTIDQNDPVFLYRNQSTATGFINVLSEVTPTVFGRVNGLPIDEYDTQHSFEHKFRFAGWAVTRKAYYEPGSRLAVAVAGSRTIWLGPTNVDWGDRLAWRFQSIDPVTRSHEAQYEHPPNDRPAESYGALIERMDPMDVVLMPQSTLTRYMNAPKESARRPLLRDVAMKRAVLGDAMAPADKHPIDACESWYANQYMATMWYGLAGALYAQSEGAQSVTDIGRLFGFDFQLTTTTSKQQQQHADGAHSRVSPDKLDTFFGVANRGLFTDPALQVHYIGEMKKWLASSAAAAPIDPAQRSVIGTMLERVQGTASTAALTALSVAVEMHNSRFVAIAHQRGYGFGKCDVYS